MDNLQRGIIFLFIGISLNVFSNETSNFCQQDIENREWKKALISCESALNQYGSASKPLTLLNDLAEISAKVDNKDKEVYYLNLMKTHPDFTNDWLHQYLWHRKMAKNAHYHFDFEQAIEHSKQAIDLAIQLNDKALQSRAYNDLGELYAVTEDYLPAIQNYQKSLTLNLQLNNDMITANTYDHIGSLLLVLEKPEESIEYFLQAIHHYQKVASKESEARITHVHENLSLAYLRSNQELKAETYIDKILASNEVRSTNDERSNVSLLLSKYYNREGQHQMAQTLLKQTLYENKPMQCLQTNLEITKTELKLGNIIKANNMALNGLQVAKNNNSSYYQSRYNHLLSQSMEQDYPELALSYLKDYQKARETFLKNKYDSQINTIEFQIKKHKFDKELLTEQLANSEKKKRIAELTKMALIIGLLILLTVMSGLFYIAKKRKQTQHFLSQIKYHKDQFALLNAAQEKQEIDNKATKVITKHDFKEALIKAMLQAVDIWNRHTGKNRVDLAEKSKVWTVTVDNGTLRTRSMDKYLSIKHIPANPRWRKVVRTCHFILSDTSLNGTDRELLNENVNEIMDVIKKL